MVNILLFTISVILPDGVGITQHEHVRAKIN